MINQVSSFLWYKLNALLRYGLIHSGNLFPVYIINEYPKSGGTWVGNLLGEATGLPFPRNRLPIFGSSILHGHFMHDWNLKNTCIVWRDGRDVLTSLYFYSLFLNEKGNDRLVNITRTAVNFDDYDNVKKNMKSFVEYSFTQCKSPHMNWIQFVDKWASRNEFCHIRYEDLKLNPMAELKKMVLSLSGKELSDDKAAAIIDKWSFERVSGRRSGNSDPKSFLRKGIVGDWKNYFDAEACEIFDYYAGDGLLTLGYETSRDWVSNSFSDHAPEKASVIPR